MDIDTNINNYTIEDLYNILDITNPTQENIVETTNKFINKFTADENSVLLNFFKQVRKRLLNYIKDNDINDTSYEDNKNEINLEQQKKWVSEQYILDEENVNDTDRTDQVEVLNTNKATMKKDKLKISDSYELPFVQGNINPVLRNSFDVVVNIDSQFRKNISDSTGNFTVNLSEPIRQVLSIKLNSIELKHSWYTFDELYGNISFCINDKTNNETYEISIPSGNYHVNTENDDILSSKNLFEIINDEINSKLSNNNIVFEYEKSTHKTKIINNSLIDYEIVFFERGKSNFYPYSKINSNLGWNFGFRPDYDYTDEAINGKFSISLLKNTEIISESMVDVYGTKYLLLVVDDFTKSHVSKNFIGASSNENTIELPEYYKNEIISSDNGQLTNSYVTTENGKDVNYVLPTFPRQYSRAQLYTINEIKKYNITKNSQISNTNVSPSLIDVLVKIPIKLGSPNYYNNIFEHVVEFTNGVNIFSNDRVYNGPVDLKLLKITLLDDKGNVVNLNGNDWSFSLTAKHLYQF